jgi:hypothetical protein
MVSDRKAYITKLELVLLTRRVCVCACVTGRERERETLIDPVGPTFCGILVIMAPWGHSAHTQDSIILHGVVAISLIGA